MMSGSIPRRTRRIRQSNDWMLTRSTRPAARTVAATALAKSSGSGTSAPDVGRELRFDVEADMLRTPGQREHLCEGRDTGTIVRTLLGQRGGIGSPRLEPAHVVAFELFQGEGIDWRPALGEEGAICSAGDNGDEPFDVLA